VGRASSASGVKHAAAVAPRIALIFERFAGSTFVLQTQQHGLGMERTLKTPYLNEYPRGSKQKACNAFQYCAGSYLKRSK
jgi:hypothetical protein